MNFDFTTPNPKTISQIDSYIQSIGGILEKRWERTEAVTLYDGPGSGWGWEGIAKERPQDMQRAFYAAINFVKDNDLDIEKIKKH